MEQREQAKTPDKIKWYVISANRVRAARVHAGMTIGETGSGDLSFDPQHAQLQLDIDGNSLLVLRALGNTRMAPAEDQDTAQQTDAMTCNRPVTISLSHNDIQIDQEFATFAPSKRPLQLRLVYLPKSEVVSETPATSDHQVDPHRTQPAGATPSSQHARSSRVRPIIHTGPTSFETRHRYNRRPIRSVILAGLAAAMAVLVVGVLFMYSSSSTIPLDSDEAWQPVAEDLGEPAPVSTAAPPTPDPDPGPDPARIFDEVRDSAEDTPQPLAPSTAPITTAPKEAAAETSQSTEPPAPPVPSNIFSRTVGGPQSVDTPSVDDKPRNIDIQQPVDTPEVISTPKTASTAQADREKSAQAERTERALQQARAQQRDLAAADLALSEGRLIAPEDSNALALYRQVLSRDPESVDALKGLATVRDQLINRAFAQLASGAWDTAKVTLNAAEEAGASGKLVADLRSEVSYQTRLARAREGEFDALYPSQRLAAITQTKPQLSRWRAQGFRQVEVEFTVTVRGYVRDVQVLGAPPAELADTLGRTVGNWLFEPVIEQGRPVPVRTRMLIKIET